MQRCCDWQQRLSKTGKEEKVMDQRVKELWTGALRSDEFTQGHNALRTIDKDTGKPCDCCLGVLCELYRREFPDEVHWTKDGAFVVPHDDYDPCSAFDCVDGNHMFNEYLPEPVIEWAGLVDENPQMGEHHAGEWNDGEVVKQYDPVTNKHIEVEVHRAPKTFTEIADLIEQHL